MHYVWDKITTTVATGRKTIYAGVIGLRTDGTDDELGSEEAFEHISVLKPLGQILMPDIRQLRDDLRPSKTSEGDAISALVVAIQMIATHCKKLKYTRRIILVTDGKGAMDAEDLSDIIKKIKADNIELIVLGVDFDDADYGFKEEDKDEQKAESEIILRTLAEDCDGVFGTMAQAISELGIPRIKAVRPTPLYKGYLTLGDPEKYDTAMCIDVERYPRVMLARPPTASSFVVRSDMAPGESSGPSSAPIQNGDAGGDVEMGDDSKGGLTAVKNARTYQIDDPDAPGGKRDVEQEELAKGYEYGRTAVHINESERDVTELETKASLDIVGFVPRDKFERYMEMSRSSVIIAQKTNDKASMGLSSLIHALFELDTFAVARYVSKDGKKPTMQLLAPSIEPDYECLLD
ncbi:ATP-dependent DNA helicase II subunit 2, partial [Coniosporium uncinatum]